ncbi:MAG: hypothetical protein ABIR08_07130 [Sphingomonas sp.]
MRVLISIAVAISIPAMALAKDSKPADPAKKTCRELEATGSLFTKRVCHTAAEWAVIDEQNRKGASDSTRVAKTACSADKPDRRDAGLVR